MIYLWISWSVGLPLVRVIPLLCILEKKKDNHHNNLDQTRSSVQVPPKADDEENTDDFNYQNLNNNSFMLSQSNLGSKDAKYQS